VKFAAPDFGFPSIAMMRTQVPPTFLPSLTIVTDDVASGAYTSHWLQKIKRAQVPLKFGTSENAHPLSQITIWEGKDGDVPKFDTFDESLFHVATLFIGKTNIQAETPELQFSSSDTIEQRTLLICQLVALLLANSNSGSAVTAVTTHLDAKSDPPTFQFVFAKNKEPASIHDIKRANKLAEVIRDGVSKPCQDFVTDLVDYMAIYSAHNQRHLSKHILDFAPPLLTQLDRMIKSGDPTVWQHEFTYKNKADEVIVLFAVGNGVTPLEGLLAMLTHLINISDRCQKPNVSGQDLATLGKYAHLLRESTLFLRFVDRIPGAHSKGLGVDLWEALRTLELFHTSTILLWEQLSDEKYKTVMPYLQILPTTPLSEFDFLAIGKKYKLSPSKSALDSPVGVFGPSLPVGDFWKFLQARAKKTGKPLQGHRHDWLKKYKALFEWDGAFTATESLHCEVKLGLDCLNRRRKGKIVIGVSKQPCLCCETWFDAVSAKAKGVKFILLPGHKKVYAGWRLSGIEDGDKKVIQKVWDMVDGIVADVKRIEDKDLVAAAPIKSQEIDLESVEISDLQAVLSHIYSDGTYYLY
jgi:hypothetical protein